MKNLYNPTSERSRNAHLLTVDKQLVLLKTLVPRSESSDRQMLKTPASRPPSTKIRPMISLFRRQNQALIGAFQIDESDDLLVRIEKVGDLQEIIGVLITIADDLLHGTKRADLIQTDKQTTSAQIQPVIELFCRHARRFQQIEVRSKDLIKFLRLTINTAYALLDLATANLCAVRRALYV